VSLLHPLICREIGKERVKATPFQIDRESMFTNDNVSNYRMVCVLL
jgi:hypothetical protein